jgi:hypothetical protein
MTKDDKQEAAWRLVKLENGLSKEKIRELTTVSTSNISNMRRVLRKLQGIQRSEDAIPSDFAMHCDGCRQSLRLGARFQYFSSSTVSGLQCVGGSGLITRFSMPGMRVLADQD